MMLQHGDDTTSGNFLQIRPENGFAPFVGAAPKPPAARTAAHWRCPWLVAGGGGVGGSPGVSAADLWALQLGAGGRSTRLNGLQRSPQGPSGMRAQVRARLQRPATSTGQGRFGDPVSPAESRQKPSGPGAGVCAAHPPGLGTSSPPPAVPQRPAPVFERTKPRPRPAAFSQPGTLLSSGLRLDPGSCHLLRPCGVGCGRGGGHSSLPRACHSLSRTVLTQNGLTRGSPVPRSHGKSDKTGVRKFPDPDFEMFVWCGVLQTRSHVAQVVLKFFIS